MISVKNHHIPATILVETALKRKIKHIEKPENMQNFLSYLTKITTSSTVKEFCGRFHLLRGDVGPLLHKRSNSKPQGIHEAELILQYVWFFVARVRIVPFIRTEPE